MICRVEVSGILTDFPDIEYAVIGLSTIDN